MVKKKRQRERGAVAWAPPRAGGVQPHGARTWLEKAITIAPTGTKMMPTTEKSRTTSRGVRIGRHALSVCCVSGDLSGGAMKPGRLFQREKRGPAFLRFLFVASPRCAQVLYSPPVLAQPSNLQLPPFTVLHAILVMPRFVATVPGLWSAVIVPGPWVPPRPVIFYHMLASVG